jgi:hypothetical protein
MKVVVGDRFSNVAGNQLNMSAASTSTLGIRKSRSRIIEDSVNRACPGLIPPDNVNPEKEDLLRT